MQVLVIAPEEAGQRLDKLLGKYLNQAGKGFLYKMMRKKNITLNGKKCDGSERLKAGDQVRLFLADETIEKFRSEVSADVLSLEAPEVIYEDSNILILNKPSGMLSQKAREQDISLNDLMLNYLVGSGKITPKQLRAFRPSICNRLDRNTSGLVVAGRSMSGLQIMNQAFKERSMEKYYLCIVKGWVREKQQIQGYLIKDHRANQVRILNRPADEAQPIATAYEPLAYGKDLTLLQVELLTGRSHQIRAHLASIGHPIGGDTKYGDPELNRRLRTECGVKNQLLHSWKLVMPETLTEPLSALAGKTFLAPVPEEFSRVQALYFKNPSR